MKSSKLVTIFKRTLYLMHKGAITNQITPAFAPFIKEAESFNSLISYQERQDGGGCFGLMGPILFKKISNCY
jgi:hypothetical protein